MQNDHLLICLHGLRICLRTCVGAILFILLHQKKRSVMSKLNGIVKRKVYIPIVATALLGIALMVVGIVLLAG